MLDYKKLVEKCRRLRLSEVISNTSIQHAKIIFQEMFEAANEIPKDQPKQLFIQTHEALASFYMDFVGPAAKLLDSGIDLRVIICKRPKDIKANPFLQMVASRNAVRLLESGESQPINFVVVGNCAYRLEKDPSRFEAIANFSDPVTAAFLARLFEQNWSKSVPLGDQSAEPLKTWAVV